MCALTPTCPLSSALCGRCGMSCHVPNRCGPRQQQTRRSRCARLWAWQLLATMWHRMQYAPTPTRIPSKACNLTHAIPAAACPTHACSTSDNDLLLCIVQGWAPWCVPFSCPCDPPLATSLSCTLLCSLLCRLRPTCFFNIPHVAGGHHRTSVSSLHTPRCRPLPQHRSYISAHTPCWRLLPKHLTASLRHAMLPVAATLSHIVYAHPHATTPPGRRGQAAEVCVGHVGECQDRLLSVCEFTQVWQLCARTRNGACLVC